MVAEKRQASHRPRTVADRGHFSVQKAEQLSGITKQTVSRWVKRLEDPDRYWEYLLGAAWKAAMGSGSSPVLSSQSCEYYTPKKYIQAALFDGCFRQFGEIMTRLK